MSPGEERFTLELPSDPAFVSTARLFASSLARHFELDEDVVADLTLAVSEACSRALASEDRDQRIELTAARGGGRLVFEISQGAVRSTGPDDTPTPSHEEMAAGLSLELISALFADAELDADASGGPVLRFSVP